MSEISAKARTRLDQGRLRRIAFRITAALLSTVLTVVTLELAAQVFVYCIAKKGKRFCPDPTTGWRVLPDLDLERFNSDGRLYRVQTGPDGRRSPTTWSASDQRRVLILGDSFAFGEGVNIEDRFDTILAETRPGWAFLNLGVSGYGTDQQAIAARPFLKHLRRGDLVILLSFANDFTDILRRSHSGRAKPWFQLNGDRLLEHPPRIRSWHILRDKSYLAAVICRRLQATRTPSAEQLTNSMDIYYAIVRELASRLQEKEVALIVAHHGDYLGNGVDLSLVYCKLQEDLSIPCLALDEYLGKKFDNPSLFQEDGHWSGRGHRIAADALDAYLDRPVIERVLCSNARVASL